MSNGMRWLRGVARIAAVVIPAGLLLLAVRRLSLQRVALELGHARPWWIVVALLCFAAILPLWALQWWLIAPATPRRTLAAMFRVVSMTSSVLNTTPMLVGEAAGVFFLASETGVDRGSGLAVLAMDQLLVGLAKLTVLTAAASVLPLPAVMQAGVRALTLGVGLLLLALMMVAWTEPARHRMITARIPSRVASIASRAAFALAPLRSPVRGGGGFLLALAKKACELVAILAIQHAFGIVLPVTSALLVLAALNLATLLPLVPGNAGVFEAAVVLAYRWLGVPAETALGMAVAQHACYFVALAVPGYGWLLRGVVPRKAAAAP